MKNSIKRLLGISVAGIMLFSLITITKPIIKPCEDPPFASMPQTVTSQRA